MFEDNLIFGKNKIMGIVSVEPEVNSLRIFQRLDGKLNEFTIPNKYWILANRPIDKSWVKLKGELHYRWGKQFNSLADMRQAKYFLKKDEEDIFCINDGKEASLVNGKG